VQKDLPAQNEGKPQKPLPQDKKISIDNGLYFNSRKSEQTSVPEKKYPPTLQLKNIYPANMKKNLKNPYHRISKYPLIMTLLYLIWKR